MDTKIIDHENYTRMMLVGHFYNLEDFDELKNEMSKYIEAGCNTVIDISRITFLSSRGLGVFITIARKFQENNLICVLYCPREEILDTIRISGIDMVVSVAETEDQVEKYFK